MPRVKRGTKRNDRRKKILKRASGYFLTKSKLYQAAQEAVERGLKFAYTGRKQKKRQFRSLWIVRIAAAAKLNGLQLFAAHQRFEEGRRRARPQDPRRDRREGRARLYQAGGPGQVGARCGEESRGEDSQEARQEGRCIASEGSNERPGILRIPGRSVFV
jgi:large subunit ribosomal protein L20